VGAGWYDVPDYARMLLNVPLVVYSGEHDAQMAPARWMEPVDIRLTLFFFSVFIARKKRLLPAQDTRFTRRPRSAQTRDLVVDWRGWRCR
jgi:hypothetical protein